MASLGNHAQGTLDGLCGIYAIVNAIAVGCGTGDQIDLFKAASNALSKKRWPEVLWDGTTFNEMQRMVRKCLDLEVCEHVRASYPFLRRTPKTNQEYWERFDEIFDREGARCAILGVTDPGPHWIVAGWDGGHVQFLDSTAGQEFARKKRSNLFAGERRQKPNQWLIDRQELILFQCET